MDLIIRSVHFSKDTLKTSKHYHDCHQILFITKGSAEIYVNQIKHIARAGDVAIFSRYENHSINIISSEYERYVLRINPFTSVADAKEYSLLLNRPFGFNNILNVTEYKNELCELFQKIEKEKNSESKMKDEMQQLLLRQLLIMLYRCNPDNFSPFDEEKFGVVYEIQKEFESNCKEEYSLKQLSEKYHISVSTLSHQFKKITGFSVFEYLYLCRIARAKYLLTKTNLSISEIVEECGFNDNSNFSRTFKRNIGVTPSAFRNRSVY